MIKVLLVGGGLQAISAARSLKNAGYVVGIISRKDDYATKSNALSYVWKVDNILSITLLLDILKKERFDVLIPMSDLYTQLLSKNENVIYHSLRAVCCVPDYDTLKIAGDKAALMDFCNQNGYPHPITQTIDSHSLHHSNLANFPFPALIKPNYSVGARGITKVDDFQDLQLRLPGIESKYGKCHLQEYIEGTAPYYNVMIYRDKQGRIVNHCILEIIRYYPLNGGSSSMCKTIENIELFEICSSVMNRLNFVGFADFDVLKTQKGDYKIIEINPRVPASLRGAEVSGINFPAIMVMDKLGQNPFAYKYTPGKILRYLGLDLMWFFSSSKRFASQPSWFQFFGKDIFYQEGGWVDKRVAVAAFLHNFRKLEIKNGRLRKKVETR